MELKGRPRFDRNSHDDFTARWRCLTVPRKSGRSDVARLSAAIECGTPPNRVTQTEKTAVTSCAKNSQRRFHTLLWRPARCITAKASAEIWFATAHRRNLETGVPYGGAAL